MDVVEAFKSTWFWIFQKKGMKKESMEVTSDRQVRKDTRYSRTFLSLPVSEQEMSTNYQPLWRMKITDAIIYVSGDDNCIQGIESATGICQKERQTSSGNSPDDFTVDVTGEIIYVDWKERQVCRLKDTGEIESLLKLRGWKPWAVCCSISGDILVAMRSEDTKHARVVGYKGHVKTREYKLDHRRQALFGSPIFLTENGNLDVCVSDSQYNRVTVIDCKGSLKFHYHGNQAMTMYPTFYPRGIATNSQFDILVADQENNCVHIIDHIGQFIRFISSKEIPLKAPYCIQVGSEDELYVGEYHQGTIKKIRYLQ